MATVPSSKPSFTPYRKWGIGLHVSLLLLVVLAVVVMVNYLSHDYFFRYHLSARTRHPLSTRTLKFLESMTNQVKVTLYYDKNDPLYSTVADLLNEYKLANSRISIQTVDYLRDAGAAQKVKVDYDLSAATDKNLIIFDCGGKRKRVEGDALAKYTLEQIVGEKDREFRRKPTEFMGEMVFTAALLDVTNPKPFKAYFLTGHREHRIDSGDELTGYMKFAAVLQQNYIQVEALSLQNTNPVPLDCNLLIIAGPTVAIPEAELEKIEQYLNEGGRLFALVNAQSIGRPTGLESILAKWGVEIGNNVVVDPAHTTSGSEVYVGGFSRHPVVNPLLGSGLCLFQPRPVSSLNTRGAPAGGTRVEVLAETGPRAFLYSNPPGQPQKLPLMVAVEKGAIKGVITERGTTRMVVAGDSLFLANRQLDVLSNRDFAGYAANWLLDRTQLLEGVGPRPINEFRLVMTRSQLQRAQWLLLGGMPGAVLLLGCLVWFRRRR